jgi:hypothetical protein
MGTRSCIGIQKENEQVDWVYCHWDGYPDGVGKTLFDCYNDPEITEFLIQQGSMSSLHETIEECEFHYRSKDKYPDIGHSISTQGYLNDAVDIGAEYIYLLRKDGWVYYTGGSSGETKLSDYFEVG